MNDKEHRVIAGEGIVRSQEARLRDAQNALTNGKAKIVAERAKLEAEWAQQISALEMGVTCARSQLDMDRAYLEKVRTDLAIGFEQL
ncbi:MAG: hypothetical protein ACJ74Y_10765 [Bryobacteraceae bacterium]